MTRRERCAWAFATIALAEERPRAPGCRPAAAKKGQTMEFEQVLYEKSGGVATITLNRPERMNAFTPKMIEEWAKALEDARVDRDVRAVIVTGAGRGFCAGADLRGGLDVTDSGQGGGPPSPADRRNWLRG